MHCKVVYNLIKFMVHNFDLSGFHVKGKIYAVAIFYFKLFGTSRLYNSNSLGSVRRDSC